MLFATLSKAASALWLKGPAEARDAIGIRAARRDAAGERAAGRILTVVLFLLVVSAVVHWLHAAATFSLTFDEPVHYSWNRRFVAAGITERDSARRFMSVTPINAPNVMLGETLIDSRSYKKLLTHFGVSMQRGRNFARRLVGLVWFLMLLCSCYWLGRILGGHQVGLLTTALVALEPTAIANSALIMTDVPFAVCTTLGCIAVLALLRRPSLLRAAAAGAVLGSALSAKPTGAVVIAAFFCGGLVSADLLPRREKPYSKAKPALQLIGLCSVMTAAVSLAICGWYRFVAVGTALGEIGFVSEPFRAASSAFSELMLPLPADFLTGLDRSYYAVNDLPFPAAILGSVYPDGVWFYFLVLWLFKTPLAIMLVQSVGLLRCFMRRLPLENAAWRFVFCAFLVYVCYFSLFFRWQSGHRYMIAAMPLLSAAAACGFVPLLGRRSLRWSAVVLVIESLAMSIFYRGDLLAYSNELVWPKRRAYALMGNGNLNYRQNAVELRKEMAALGIAASRLQPPHVLAGPNILSPQTIYDPNFRWLLENIEADSHVLFSHFLFNVDQSQFEHYLRLHRTLEAPATLWHCTERRPQREVLLKAGEALEILPRPDAARGSFRICVTVTEEATIRFELSSNHSVEFAARLGRRQYDYVQLRPGQEAWYVLRPGRHELVITQSSIASGEMKVVSGEVSFEVVTR